LFGCGGYQFGQGNSLSEQYQTISVPYVVGDVDGSLTAAVIKRIVRSGAFEYRQIGGSLVLHIRQIEIHEENIGFRYDRKKRGKLTREIIPTESRMIDRVEILLVDSSGSAVLGPVQLSASVDFDHDYYFSRNSVNIFSLGQLNDVDEARNAVQTPLHEAIAEKIVDYISQSW